MSSEIENECRLSYFKVIGTVNEKHNVYYVQNVEDKKIYVKKTLSVYNKDVYEYIKSTGSAFYPKIYECVEKDNHLIVIEEYINGDTLEEIIRKTGRTDRENRALRRLGNRFEAGKGDGRAPVSAFRCEDCHIERW